jgi:hypothetical protein
MLLGLVLVMMTSLLVNQSTLPGSMSSRGKQGGSNSSKEQHHSSRTASSHCRASPPSTQLMRGVQHLTDKHVQCRRCQGHSNTQQQMALLGLLLLCRKRSTAKMSLGQRNLQYPLPLQHPTPCSTSTPPQQMHLLTRTTCQLGVQQLKSQPLMSQGQANSPGQLMKWLNQKISR